MYCTYYESLLLWQCDFLPLVSLCFFGGFRDFDMSLYPYDEKLLHVMIDAL